MRIGKRFVVVALGITVLILGLVLTTVNKKHHSTIQQLQLLERIIDETETISESLKEKNKLLEEKNDQLEEEINELKNQVIELSKARYDKNDITKKSNVTYTQLHNALEGTEMQELSSLIIEAEREYGVNALFLTGLIAHETGYGTSRRYREDNNVGGYEVYTTTSKGRTFDSKASSVVAVAKLLSNNYLNPEGRYYNGTSSYDINILYCTESNGGQFEWHKTIDSIAEDIKEDINNSKKDT